MVMTLMTTMTAMTDVDEDTHKHRYNYAGNSDTKEYKDENDNVHKLMTSA